MNSGGGAKGPGRRYLRPEQTDIVDYGFHPRAEQAVYAGEPATPRLAVQLQGGQVTLSWTAREEGYVLERSPQVTGAEWSPVPGVARDGVNYQVTLPVEGGGGFFRLRQ